MESWTNLIKNRDKTCSPWLALVPMIESRERSCSKRGGLVLEPGQQQTFSLSPAECKQHEFQEVISKPSFVTSIHCKHCGCSPWGEDEDD